MKENMRRKIVIKKKQELFRVKNKILSLSCRFGNSGFGSRDYRQQSKPKQQQQQQQGGGGGGYNSNFNNPMANQYGQYSNYGGSYGGAYSGGGNNAAPDWWGN